MRTPANPRIVVAARRRIILSSLLAAIGCTAAVGLPSSEAAPVQPTATPSAACDAGSLPEQIQGRAPLSDVATGRYAKGYRCNAVRVGGTGGASGGYRVERYVDRAGHECAYWDTTLLFPGGAEERLGTSVLDMSNPARPVQTTTLKTPAFLSPHESMRLNARRGLLTAVEGNLFTAPGVLDVYDVSQDCRHPELLSSTPLGILGHESGFAPDGRTLYVASNNGMTLAAVDLTDPNLPGLLWAEVGTTFAHGVSVSDDGRTLYVTEAPGPRDNGVANPFVGLRILDVSQIQARALAPTVVELSRLTWPDRSIPQNATPFRSKGRTFVLEIDEFADQGRVGAARIIDVQNPRKPAVVSHLRLEVHSAKQQAASLSDPGATGVGGYGGHYCTLPSRLDPSIVACSFAISGLRVFDIADPMKPVEIAYWNQPKVADGQPQAAIALSAPAYDPRSNDIWFSASGSGFHAIRLTGAARRAFARTYVNAGS